MKLEKNINVGKIARTLIILGLSSIAIAVFCAFYPSDVTSSGVPGMRFSATYPLEEYGPIFLIAGGILLASGWGLRDYALRHPTAEAYESPPTPATLAMEKSRKGLVARALEEHWKSDVVKSHVAEYFPQCPLCGSKSLDYDVEYESAEDYIYCTDCKAKWEIGWKGDAFKIDYLTLLESGESEKYSNLEKEKHSIEFWREMMSTTKEKV